MINQNARRTGAAGVMARALGTLGAATLLLTSTGWGALAGDTGFGAVNAKAYQGVAAPGPAAKGANNAQSPVSGPPAPNNQPTWSDQYGNPFTNLNVVGVLSGAMPGGNLQGPLQGAPPPPNYLPSGYPNPAARQYGEVLPLGQPLFQPGTQDYTIRNTVTPLSQLGYHSAYEGLPPEVLTQIGKTELQTQGPPPRWAPQPPLRYYVPDPNEGIPRHDTGIQPITSIWQVLLGQ